MLKKLIYQRARMLVVDARRASVLRTTVNVFRKDRDVMQNVNAKIV